MVCIHKLNSIFNFDLRSVRHVGARPLALNKRVVVGLAVLLTPEAKTALLATPRAPHELITVRDLAERPLEGVPVVLQQACPPHGGLVAVAPEDPYVALPVRVRVDFPGVLRELDRGYSNCKTEYVNT